MATSKNFGKKWNGNYYTRTTIAVSSQSISNNTSTMRVRVYFGTASGWWIDAKFITSFSGVGSGASTSETQRSVAGGAEVQFATWVRTVTHKADGTLSLNVKGRVRTTNVVSFDATSGGSFSPDRIPRGPRVRSGGKYKQTVAYVKSGGKWKIAIPYVKSGGKWKIGGG